MQFTDQYNTNAQKYAEIFVVHNRESISDYFRTLEIVLEGKKVLDLGCGDGYDLCRIQKKGAIIYGIDSSKEMVRLALSQNPSAQVVEGRCDAIPFADSSFDVVISKWVFQNASEIDPIFREVARVLKPGGSFIYLSSHPIRQFLEKKRKNKNYFEKEMVHSIFFDGKMYEDAPSHTLNEYLSQTFFKYFTLLSYEENHDSGAEKVDGDVFPSYFIIKAERNNSNVNLNSSFSNVEHEKVENSYNGSSSHRELLVDFIESEILPHVLSKDRFLDIGAGPGDVTELLAPHFAQTCVVDPNPQYVPFYKGHDYEIFSTNLLEAPLSTYDFVLCSHVLYYIEQKKWPDAVQKIYDAIDRGGTGLILVMGPRGSWHDLCMAINPNYAHGEKLSGILKEKAIKHRRTFRTAVLKLANREEVEKLVCLYAIVDCFTPEEYEALLPEKKQEVKQKCALYVDACKRPDATYEVPFDTDFFVLHK